MTADANGNPVLQTIYNPLQCTPQNGTCVRPQFQGNVIPGQDINPIGQALLKLYPEPNVSGDQFGLDNYRTSILTNAPGHQFDVKIDHYFNDKQRVAIRYSQSYGEYNVPFVLANANFNDGFTSSTTVHNIGLEYNWTLTPNTVWTNRFAVDRVSAPVNSAFPNLQSVGFPSSLAANGLDRMPSIQLDGTNDWLSMFTQCCTDTSFAHTLYSYSSAITWVKHEHTIKVGFEQRQFFNNFWQPNYPTGNFYFPQSVTASTPITSDTTQGNSFASLLRVWRKLRSARIEFHQCAANGGRQIVGNRVLPARRLEGHSKTDHQPRPALRVEFSVHGEIQPAAVQRFQRQ